MEQPRLNYQYRIIMSNLKSFICNYRTPPFRILKYGVSNHFEYYLFKVLFYKFMLNNLPTTTKIIHISTTNVFISPSVSSCLFSESYRFGQQSRRGRQGQKLWRGPQMLSARSPILPSCCEVWETCTTVRFVHPLCCFKLHFGSAWMI